MQDRKSNFDFLASHDELLAQLGATAEQAFISDSKPFEDNWNIGVLADFSDLNYFKRALHNSSAKGK